VSLSAANVALAFYEIGVDPRVVLPAHANVLAGWLIKLGLALWVATLVHWELRLARARRDSVFMAPIAEATLTSVSALSRGMFLFHALPYCLVLLGRSPHVLRGLGRRRLATLALLTVAGFAVSLGAVSALRILVYPPAVVAQATRPAGGHDDLPPAAPQGGAGEGRPDHAERFGSRRLSFAGRELLGLVVERWNGMEGVLAVSSHEGVGGDLLLSAVRERPAAGQDALYQRISGATQVYERTDGYTFLTLPGIVGIFAYSGSMLVVVVGMAGMTLLVLTVEGVLRRFVDNPYLASIAGFAMATELVQANFPYLLGTFFILLVSSLVALAVVAIGPARLSTQIQRLARQ
jgi:hypothetical protein